MHWPKLLSHRRLGENKVYPYDSARPPWQVDYDRIIFSSAFRRLQDKTQVHPLSGSDYVRTRLTHSLEVSSVARTLGTKAGAFILQKHGKDAFDDGKPLSEVLCPADFGMITAAAALAHDIGNPPFGHSGERAIRYWFATSPIARKIAAKLTPQEIQDFERWEGNAEGFRILARRQFNKQHGGMRVTMSTLAAFMKYPTASNEVGDKVASGNNAATKKPGFFMQDMDLWRMVATDVGLLQEPGKNWWCRHPLVYLTEAADDICYRLIDLEDGQRLGLISYPEMEALCEPLLDAKAKNRLADFSPTDRTSYLRAVSITTLMDKALERFKERETAILDGSAIAGLFDNTDEGVLLDTMRTLTVEKIYSAPNVLQIEAAGFEIIPGLLDAFVGAMEDMAEDSDTKGNLKLKSEKLITLIPSEFIGENGKPLDSPYARLLEAVDFVAGMTDTFALDLFRKIRGVTIPR